MRLSRFRHLRSISIAAIDIVTIIAVIAIAYIWRIGDAPDLSDAEFWLITATFMGVLFICGTYFKERSSELPSLPVRTFFVCLTGGLLCIFWLYLLGPDAFNDYFGRGILPISTVTIGIFTTLSRFVVNRLYHAQESEHRVLYLGFSNSTHNFFQELNNHNNVREVSVVSDECPPQLPSNVSYIELSQLPQQLREAWQSVIIDPQFHPNPQQQAALVAAKLAGTNVGTLADYYETNWFQIPIYDIGNDWFLRSSGFSVLASSSAKRIKRLIDVLLATIVLAISTPLIMVFGIIVKLESKGSMLYSQSRVGLNGRLFTIYKLRTMRSDTRASKAQWASEDDPRITRVGRFLRKSRIDELPQAWNVLVGDMSFVGPRPEQPEFTEWLAQEIPFYDLRHQVKPGITGWAQVIFAYGASKEDAIKKLQYELYYIKHQSLLFDLNILLRTITTIAQRSGR